MHVTSGASEEFAAAFPIGEQATPLTQAFFVVHCRQLDARGEIYNLSRMAIREWIDHDEQSIRSFVLQSYKNILEFVRILCAAILNHDFHGTGRNSGLFRTERHGGITRVPQHRYTMKLRHGFL